MYHSSSNIFTFKKFGGTELRINVTFSIKVSSTLIQKDENWKSSQTYWSVACIVWNKKSVRSCSICVSFLKSVCEGFSFHSSKTVRRCLWFKHRFAIAWWTWICLLFEVIPNNIVFILEVIMCEESTDISQSPLNKGPMIIAFMKAVRNIQSACTTHFICNMFTCQ